MEQRFVFDQVADAYKAARPDYPEALVEDVVSYAELKPKDWILEVGCGAGQATKGFASRGFPILAIDPGPKLLAGARESLGRFKQCRVPGEHVRGVAREPREIPADHRCAVVALGVPRRCGS